MKQLQLMVSGMDCTSCEHRLETAVSHVDGVARSKADHRAGSLSVVIDPSKANEEAIRASVEKAGFGVS
ncbi:MAG TPA: heavy-metal-associated domain-containing protein [Candidatus Acidoferrales bacterium]|nr:heavy-metal-associated domain-containing protein [Candidatus Acidoferrales bacterium]